ncbi:hypothetical protein DRJ71_18575, partial [Enterococcus faecalis]
PSEISRNSPKIKEQFSEIPSYFSELNASIPTSFFTKKCQYSEKKKRFQFLFFFICFTIIIETINDFFYAERSGYYVTTISKNYDSNRWF